MLTAKAEATGKFGLKVVAVGPQDLLAPQPRAGLRPAIRSRGPSPLLAAALAPRLAGPRVERLGVLKVARPLANALQCRESYPRSLTSLRPLLVALRGDPARRGLRGQVWR